ncbi:MAG: hypothetical protein JO025_14985 [Verrucomicrobia bacterium]|nr:hypothetical protein [Verrucomicrobiota bacterium]
MEAAIELGQDAAFHRWRIQAKNLYYELVGGSGMKSCAVSTARLCSIGAKDKPILPTQDEPGSAGAIK